MGEQKFKSEEKSSIKYSHTILAISCFFISAHAYSWGSVGHTLIAKHAMRKMSPSHLLNCKISASDIIDHVNDPDLRWKNQRILHPHESKAHYYNAHELPSKNKNILKEQNLETGFIFERIFSWTKEASNYRTKGDFLKLHEKLVGLSHYLADLTQPLHMHHDYDGITAGIPGIHSQFESTMVAKFKDEIDKSMSERLSSSINLKLWEKEAFESIVFTVADQSYLLTSKLFDSAKSAYQVPIVKNKKIKKSRYHNKPHWVKSILWTNTGNIAITRMSTASELIARAFTEICR